MQYNQSHAKYVFIEVWNNLIKITATRLERVCGATHRGFESLPLCHSSSKPPQNRHSLHFKSVQQRDYDNLPQKKTKNCDNLHLYRVNEIYYYRRNINKKFYRISLKTKDLKQQ